MPTRERTARPARAGHVDTAARGIDDLDSLDQLDLLDWNVDPWDEVPGAGRVEQLRRQTRSIKWVCYALLAVGTVFVLAAGATGWWYLHQINPEGEPGRAVNFTVKADDSLRTISERLEAAGLVKDAGVFRWYVDHHGGLEITPGYYQLARRDHMGNIMGRLRTPPGETYTKVTFPEGFTVTQMAGRLGDSIVPMRARDFIAAAADPNVSSPLRPSGITSLEGLLFPDTYQVSNGESEGQVVERMMALMERVAGQEDMDTKSAQLSQTPYNILIIASMIEKEAKLAEDRPKIARVIYNRLARGIPLAIDATSLYGQPPGTDPDDVVFVDGPYNTRLRVGLPPTPISNPGRASIRAALNPAPNPSVGDPICVDLPADVPCEYLFYALATEDGGHAFAATLEQHEANVARARAAGLFD